MRLTAADLQSRYGRMLCKSPWVEKSPYLLVKALDQKGIVVTHAVARQWALRYRSSSAAGRGGSSHQLTASELQTRHGGMLSSGPWVDLSAYRMVKRLADQRIFVT